jgi:hypothetical protein
MIQEPTNEKPPLEPLVQLLQKGKIKGQKQ